MSSWRITYSDRVLKEDLATVGHAAFDVARRAIEKKLKINPREYGANLHHPLHGFRKLKASHVRIVYRVDADASTVLILMIADRRDIWATEQAEILDRDDNAAGRARLRQRTGKAKKKK